MEKGLYFVIPHSKDLEAENTIRIQNPNLKRSKIVFPYFVFLGCCCSDFVIGDLRLDI